MLDNKYDINPEDNMPQFVYGIPDDIINKHKYDINPEDNVPQEVYGIPDFMEVDNKYNINPEDNVPQKVYGIPNFIKQQSSTSNLEYDYSNCIPTIENIIELVEYMANTYNDFKNAQVNDEEDNKKLKAEYKEWKYKNCYSDKFEVYITDKSYSSTICEDYSSFITAIESGKLVNISKMKITLNIDYKRGIGDNLDTRNNHYSISYEPYNIIFKSSTNNNDEDTKYIENNIKEILNKMIAVNSIFCSK